MPKLSYIVVFLIFHLVSKVHSNNNNKISGSNTHACFEQIQVLHTKGQQFISQKFYSRASNYYTAMMQLLGDNNSTNCRELRLKCLTSLSFCDFKQESFYHAISRCTDIIDEFSLSTAHDDSKEHFRKLLGKAYYRRGLTFYKLNLPHLAVGDIKIAQEMLPDDNDQISNKLQQILSESKNDGVGNYDDDVDHLIVNSSSYEVEMTNILTYARNVTLDSKKKLLPTEIEALIGGTDSEKELADSSSNSVSNMLSGLGSDFSGGLGDNMKSIFNNMPLSGFGSSRQGSTGSLSAIMNQVELFAPMIQKMTGIDSETLKNCIDIGTAIVNVYTQFSRLFQSIIKYSGFIIAFIWVLLTALSL